jgi:hypothetical protein
MAFMLSGGTVGQMSQPGQTALTPSSMHFLMV